MNITSNTSYGSSMVEEATETAAQTKAEAAKGDQQAVRKQAREQQANAAPAPQQTVDSDKGQLDAKA